MTLEPPRIPFVSGSTGRLITREEATDPQYWVRQMRHPVYFGDGIRELLKDPSRVFLEVGPGMTLTSLTRQNADPALSPTVLASLPDLRERRSVTQGLLTTVARMWLSGIDIDWMAFHQGERRSRIALPVCVFDRQRYWIEPDSIDPPATNRRGASKTPPLVLRPSWTRRLVAGRGLPGPPAELAPPGRRG